MEKRKLWASLIMTAATLVVLCATLTVSTFAWFTFDPFTNVTPMEGKISEGDTTLLISEKKDRDFDKKCELHPADLPDKLNPVSSYDLTKFYTSSAQNYKGISTAYRDVTEKLADWLIHGTLYLKSVGTECDVFFHRPPLDLGEDNQVLTAGRLGMKFTDKDGKSTSYIFRLDSLGSDEGVKKKRTVAPAGADGGKRPVVVQTNTGKDLYADDPAVSISQHLMDETGAKKLLRIRADEVVTVEYWLYLEGCDDACSNPVRSKDVTLQLGFAGKPVKEE